MKETKTRIKVVRKYKGKSLIKTEYHPQYLEKCLCFTWWADISDLNALSYLEIKPCLGVVWECQEWVEGFVLWWREFQFSEESSEVDYYGWPEE